MAQAAIIVPCRLESTRFPRKLLHKIKGRPLLRWVAERIAREAPDFPLFFAVDHELLGECVAGAGFAAIMTDSAHQSGTDRLAEANRTVKADFVINVQADEPLVTGRQIRALATLLASGAPMATLATPFHRADDFANPNQVKVVMAPFRPVAIVAPPAAAGAPGGAVRPLHGERGTMRALFFSRAPIPYARDRSGIVDNAWLAANRCYKHLGLYGYRADLLARFAQLPVGRLEQIEKLEQLRVLENGYEIACDLTEDPTIGVDTLEDALKFEAAIDAQAPAGR